MTDLPPDDCPCDGCAALRSEASGDLLDFYRVKLLIRGWAGKTTPAEKAYQRAHAPFVQAAVRSAAGRTPGWLKSEENAEPGAA